MNIVTLGLPVYTITLHQVLPSWNPISRKHWTARDSANTEWFDEFGWLATKLPRDVKHVYLAFEIFCRTNSGRDADNAMAAKFTQDSLVKLGVIPDDTPEYVTSFPPKISVDPKNPRTEIMVIVDREGTSTCEVVIMGGSSCSSNQCPASHTRKSNTPGT